MQLGSLDQRLSEALPKKRSFDIAKRQCWVGFDDLLGFKALKSALHQGVCKSICCLCKVSGSRKGVCMVQVIIDLRGGPGQSEYTPENLLNRGATRQVGNAAQNVCERTVPPFPQFRNR